jgi:uncharacterized protein (UPF0218 family)
MNIQTIIEGIEIAHKAKSRRKTQAFTASEEPVVIQALISCGDVLARLLMEDTTNVTSQVNDQTASRNC